MPEIIGRPTSVEIINHCSFSVDRKTLKVYLAKIFNPAIAVTSVSITARIEHVTVIDNTVEKLYEDTFDLIMNTIPVSSIVVTSTACVSDSFSDELSLNGKGWFVIYPPMIEFMRDPNDFYYVVRFTSDFKPMNSEVSTFNYCIDTSSQIECLPFTDINYMIIRNKRDRFNSFFDIYSPQAISQVPTTYTNLVWQKGRLLGKDLFTISALCWQQIVGSMSSVKIFQVKSSFANRLNQRRAQVYVSFTISNNLPADGTIQIIWPSNVATFPHCHSATASGSSLFAMGSNQSGQVGCLVQDSNTWVITSFQGLGAGSNIIIQGQVTLPNIQKTLGTGYIITYNNTHDTDIRTNGFIIDRWSGNFQIYVQNIASWNVDSQITLEQTLPLRVNYVGPLQFKFKLGQNFLGANAGKIQIKLAKKSTSYQNGGFTVDLSKKHVCQFTQILSYQKIGCIVTKVTDDTTMLHYQNIKFDIISSSMLESAKTYAFKLTTLTGLQYQGLSHPTAAGTYKIDVNFDTTGNKNYGMHNQLYLEVYGTPFTKLNVLSFMSNQGQNNLLWFDISPTTTISLTDQLVIQVPTKSSNNQVLFANDLGLGLSDGANIIYDIIKGTFFGTNDFMECRLYHGDQSSHKPAKIICGKFKQTISSSQNLFMAIKIVNPTISPDQISVPFFIYTFQPGKSTKTNFNVVENAVYIRTSPRIRSDVGNLNSKSQRLQTPQQQISFITRHYNQIQIGEYYVVQFQFPLRVNGKVGSCYKNSNYVYGDAYYHKNLWFIVCQVTTNVITVPGDGSVQKNLYINGFYTPWYLLSSSQKVVKTYAYHHLTRYTQIGILSDLYPQQGPKYSTTSPIFTMNAINQKGAMYQQLRDDYSFSIIYDTSSTVDIAYTKLIAIIFPSEVYGFKEQDCTEASTSQVQIEQCWIETSSNRVIWIRPVAKNTYTSNLKIDIVTQNLAIKNPKASPIDLDTFIIKFYSWENIGQPSLAPLSNNNYCFLIMDKDKKDVLLNYNSLNYPISDLDYVNFPYQRYYQETPWSDLTHRSPFEMEFMPSVNFDKASGMNYHQIKLHYPSTFGDTTQSTNGDLKIFKPICYLNNFRISKCNIDTTNNFIWMNFQFALTENVSYHVYFSILDPRNPDDNGFLTSAAISNIRFQYQAAGSSTIYYTESDSFPSLASLPTGILVGPFRGITAGQVQFGHAINDKENIIIMKLTFNRTDITGLVIEIPMYDNSGNQLYRSSDAFQKAFYYVGDGQSYPCGNNGINAGGNVKCILSRGDYKLKGTSTKIIMTDFTYVSQMNCRFLFVNPQYLGTYFSIIVRAFGGTKSDTNLYGDKYIGQWKFQDIFITQSGTQEALSFTSTAYRLPTKSPWRNQTTHYVFSKYNKFQAKRISIAKFILYDSSSVYVDKQYCRAQLSSTADSDDDLLIVDYQPDGKRIRYAYFVRKWPNQVDLGISLGNGWGLNYVKCKHYSTNYYGYFFHSDIKIESVTFNFDAAHMSGLVKSPFSQPTNPYLEITNRVQNSEAHVIGQFDITALLLSISDFGFQNSDSMILKMNWENSGIQWWGTQITGCYAIGGFISTSPQKPVECHVANNKQFYFTNISGFQADPLLPKETNKRIKFMFKSKSLVYADANSDIFYLRLYANHDAYEKGLLPIFQQSNNLKDIKVALQASKFGVVYDQNIGTLTLDKLTDDFMSLSYSPASDHIFPQKTSISFNISFHGFSLQSCSLSSVKIQIGLKSIQPGQGYANTLVANTICQSNQISFYWQMTNLRSIFNELGQSSDNTFSTLQKIIVQIYILPRIVIDLPVLHHQYAYITSSFTMGISEITTIVRGTVSLPVQPLADSATLSTIFPQTNTNRNGVTELMLQLTNLKYPLGSALENYLLLIEFLAPNTWGNTKDPFKTYINTDHLDEKIQCKCLSGKETLSSSTFSSFIDATCRRRKPTPSFNAYAIIVDQTVKLGENLRCYFPQFYIFQNMIIKAEIKRIYGWSYLPDINLGNTKYGSIFRTKTNQLNFDGTTPSMPTSTLSIQDGNYYSSTINVGTIFSGPYTLSASWTGTYSTPYLYVNFNKAGPVPVFDFCSDSNIYLECRVYSKLLNLVIGKMKSSSVTSFSFSNILPQTIYYPSSQFSINTDFNGFAYVGQNGWERYGTLNRPQSTLAPISDNIFNVVPDSFGSKKSSFSTILLFAMNTNGKTLYNYFLTQSKIQITYSSLAQQSQCMVWVQNEPQVELTCQTSTGLIRVYSLRTDYTTSNIIWVSLGITNPTTEKQRFTMKLYDYYYSASRYSLVINKQIYYTIDNSYISNTKIQKSRLQIYPFRSRISSKVNSPLRVQFKLKQFDLIYGLGNIQLISDQFAYSSNCLCYYYEFQSFTNMIQRTQYNIMKATYALNGNNILIYPPKFQKLSHSKYYQLIVMPIGINVAGCAQGCQSQSGFHQTNSPKVYIFVPNNNYAIVYGHSIKLYAYEEPFKITLDRIFYLTNQPLETSIFFQFKLNFASALSYPNHYLEFILYDLTSDNFPGYSLNNIIPCQLSDNFLKINYRKDPQCRLTSAGNSKSFVKILIQNFGPISSGTYWVALDDITLPSPPDTSGAKKFDFTIRFQSGDTRYENFFKEIFVIDGTSKATPTTQLISFSNPSQTQYGYPMISGQLNFAWPFDSSSNVYESKIIIKINGGYSAVWPKIDSVTFTDDSSSTGTYQLLWINKKLNKFVILMPKKASGTSTTLYINNLQNPYAYQKQAYNLKNNLQIIFYQNYYKSASNTINQPAFTIFQKNPSITYMKQNYPANSLDIYPTTNSFSSGALVKLTLSITFQEIFAQIIKRKLDTLDIQFTSGLNYIQECGVFRNNSQYVYELGTCQTFLSAGNWHIIIYGIIYSQLNVDWTIQVFATFSSAKLEYTSRIKGPNDVVEYQNIYSMVMTSYDTTRNVPAILSWLNRKYVKNYYQNQFRPLSAVTNQATPYLRFRIRTPQAFDGQSDYIRLYLDTSGNGAAYSPKNSKSQLIYQLLPAQQAQGSFRDFSIGIFNICSFNTQGNYYHLSGLFGGIKKGQDYLLQIQQPNIVTTSFYLPTSPRRNQLTFLMYVFENNYINRYTNSFFVDSYRSFRQVQILHTTTTVSDYDTISIYYKPDASDDMGGLISAGSSSRQLVLRLSISGKYHERDAGIVSIYSKDGKNFINGGRFSEFVSNPNGAQVTTLQFSQYQIENSPLYFSLSKMSAYTDNVQYQWHIPLVKNPSAAYAALRYNLTLYVSDIYSLIPINHYESINQYYTVADSSVSFSATLHNTNRNVQAVNGIDLYIDFGSYSVLNGDAVTFKLDNSLKGLISDFKNCNDTQNYDYYYFHTLNMVMARKKTSNIVKSVGIGISSGSINFKRDFGLNWVKIFDTSPLKMTSNPQTIKYSTPAALSLNILTSYTKSSVKVIINQEPQNEGFITTLKIQIQVPIIPEGGNIKIEINQIEKLVSADDYCRVGKNFVRSSNDQEVLRCQRASDGFLISGFAPIAAGTNIEIIIYMKNNILLKNFFVKAKIFGINLDSTSGISQDIIYNNTVFVPFENNTVSVTAPHNNNEISTSYLVITIFMFVLSFFMLTSTVIVIVVILKRISDLFTIRFERQLVQEV